MKQRRALKTCSIDSMKQVSVFRVILLKITLWLTIVPLCAQQSAILENGTKIPIKFSVQISSEDKIEPQVVVATNIVDFNGNILISEGSFVKVYWNKISSERNGNNGGKITVNFSYAQAVDGKYVYLSGGYEAQGKSNIAGNFITMNGKKLKGKPAVIQAGTTYDGVITKQAYDIKVQKKSTIVKKSVPNTIISSVPLTTSSFFRYQKEYLGNYSKIILNPDYTFKLTSYGQDGPFNSAEGKYSLDNSTITFHAKHCYLDYDGYGANKVINCSEFSGSTFYGKVIKDNTSIFYSEYLSLDFASKQQYVAANRYGVPETEPVNQIRKYDGQDVYVLEKKDAYTTSVANMRQIPNTKGKLVKRYNWETPTGEASSKIPINEKITVIGRTPEKYKVGSWEDYWYLIEVEEYLPDEKDYVWVYGQNIKF